MSEMQESVILCPVHKKYKAIRRPKAKCDICLAAYERIHSNDNAKAEAGIEQAEL